MAVAELGLTLGLGTAGLRASLRDLDTERLLASGNVAADRVPELPAEVAEAIADAMGRGVVRLWLRPAPGMRDHPWETLRPAELGGTPLALTPGLRLVHEGSYSGVGTRRSSSSNPRILVAAANPGTAIYPPLRLSQSDR